MEDLSKHKFCISPPGNGVDCHRTWECLYLGVIPIVEKSPHMSYFDDLPILFVDNYDNISVDRETKGIKITIRGNLFKSASAEIDSLYFPVVDQIGKIIKKSELMNVQSNKDYSNFLVMIDKQGAALNIEIRCEGHTDDQKLPLSADYPSNWELSAARSLNIVTFFLDRLL